MSKQVIGRDVTIIIFITHATVRLTLQQEMLQVSTSTITNGAIMSIYDNNIFICFLHKNKHMLGRLTKR